MARHRRSAQLHRRLEDLQGKFGGGEAEAPEMVFCLEAEPGQPRSEKLIRWGDSPILVIRNPAGQPWNLPTACANRPCKLIFGVDPDDV